MTATQFLNEITLLFMPVTMHIMPVMGVDMPARNDKAVYGTELAQILDHDIDYKIWLNEKRHMG